MKQSHYVRYPALERCVIANVALWQKSLETSVLANDTILSETQSMAAKNFLVLVTH